MSRIHDALGRVRSPANSPAPPRSAHADAVLAALGYPSEKPGVARRLALAVAVVAIVIATGWALRSVVSRVGGRGPSVADPAPPTALAISPAPKAQAPPTTAPASEDTRSVPAGAPNVTPAAASTNPVPQPTRPAALPSSERRNDPRSAILDLRAQAVPPASRPTPPRDEFQMALYYQRAGDFEQALLHYRAALQRDEMNVEAHNNLGSLYFGRDLLDEAAREFQRVLAIDPRYVPAHINLSATLYKLGRFDAAAAQAREALRIDSRSGDAFVNLALAQKAAGQPGDSQGSLRRALELNPRHAIAHYNLARQYEESGEAVRALEHYRQFLQYAGPEQEPYAVDVRARMLTLQPRAAR